MGVIHQLWFHREMIVFQRGSQVTNEKIRSFKKRMYDQQTNLKVYENGRGVIL